MDSFSKIYNQLKQGLKQAAIDSWTKPFFVDKMIENGQSLAHKTIKIVFTPTVLIIRAITGGARFFPAGNPDDYSLSVPAGKRTMLVIPYWRLASSHRFNDEKKKPGYRSLGEPVTGPPHNLSL